MQGRHGRIGLPWNGHSTSTCWRANQTSSTWVLAATSPKEFGSTSRNSCRASVLQLGPACMVREALDGAGSDCARERNQELAAGQESRVDRVDKSRMARLE